MIKGKIPSKFALVEEHRSSLKTTDVALGTGEWFLPGGGSDHVKITHDTLSMPSIIRDFVEVAGRVTSLSQPAIPLLDFLEQFHDIENRWPGHFDSRTRDCRDLIAKCAKFQTALIHDKPFSLETIPRGSLLIALTLRCLTLTREMPLLTASTLQYRGDSNGLSSWTVERIYDLNPIIELSDSPEESDLSSDMPDQSHGESISSMLEDLLSIIQTNMMRRKPQDWPALLFTLCLLCIIINCFGANDFLADSFFDSFAALRDVFYILCDLFDITSKGFLPLQERWPKEAYSKLVNDEDHLVEAFQWVHDVWLNGTFSNYREIYSS